MAESNWRDATAPIPHFAISESLLSSAEPWQRWRRIHVAPWNGQSLSSGQLAKVYGFTDLDGSQPDAWRYVPEIQDAGKPADTTGYRQGGLPPCQICLCRG